MSSGYPNMSTNGTSGLGATTKLNSSSTSGYPSFSATSGYPSATSSVSSYPSATPSISNYPSASSGSSYPSTSTTSSYPSMDSMPQKTPFMGSTIPSIQSYTQPKPTFFPSQPSGLKKVICPNEIVENFLRISQQNTTNKLETCAILAGKDEDDHLLITTLIVPK